MKALPDNISSIFSSEIVKTLGCGRTKPVRASPSGDSSELSLPPAPPPPLRRANSPSFFLPWLSFYKSHSESEPPPTLPRTSLCLTPTEPNSSSSNEFQSHPCLHPLDPNRICGYYTNQLSKRLFIQETK